MVLLGDRHHALRSVLESPSTTTDLGWPVLTNSKRVRPHSSDRKRIIPTVSLSLPKISSACRHPLLEKLIEATVHQRCNGVLHPKAGSAERSS